MFNDYYFKYLGIDKGMQVNDLMVCKTQTRDLPLNKKYIYRIIISDYNNKRFVSISPTISDGLCKRICDEIRDKDIDEILQSRGLNETGLRLSKMYRMILERESLRPYNQCSDLNVEYRKEYRKYVIRDNDDIAAYCKISDVDFGYGNIVVWTDENYRRRGYARELLLTVLSRCTSEGIEPLYFVDSQNTASIELAKSVGFTIAQTEIIGCEILDT